MYKTALNSCIQVRSLRLEVWSVLSYIGQGKAQVSPEGRGDLDQVISRQPQVPAVGQPLVIAHVVGLVLSGREPGARGVEVVGDAFGGELDGFTLVLEICQQLSADVLQRAADLSKPTLK